MCFPDTFIWECGVERGVGIQVIFVARESGIKKIFFKIPDFLEMSHFYIQNL